MQHQAGKSLLFIIERFLYNIGMRKTREAFHWIIFTLRKHKIPFQISGGLAAKAYGSTRELADIDIDIPEKRVPEILSDINKFIIFGPGKYKDKNWDIFLITLRYQGQDIDLGGFGTAKIFDKRKRKWIRYPIDSSKTAIKKVFGLKVPVISKKNLIEYKSGLQRKVDKIDIAIIKNS